MPKQVRTSRASCWRKPMADAAAKGGIRFQRTVPIMRIFDEAKAKEFYLGFLGFGLDW